MKLPSPLIPFSHRLCDAIRIFIYLELEPYDVTPASRSHIRQSGPLLPPWHQHWNLALRRCWRVGLISIESRVETIHRSFSWVEDSTFKHLCQPNRALATLLPPFSALDNRIRSWCIPLCRKRPNLILGLKIWYRNIPGLHVAHHSAIDVFLLE